MSRTLTVEEAESDFEALIRHTARTWERVTVTEDGVPMAVLVAAAEVAELEEREVVLKARLREKRVGGARPDPGQAAGTSADVPDGEAAERPGPGQV